MANSSPDLISRIATVAPPIYFLFRIDTGSREFVRFAAIVGFVVAMIYLPFLFTKDKDEGEELGEDS